MARRQANSRRSIPALRFGKNMTCVANLVELRLDGKRVLLAGDDPQVLWRKHVPNAQDRLLQQGIVFQQWQELLGILGSAQRPQSGPASAGKNNGMHTHNGDVLSSPFNVL